MKNDLPSKKHILNEIKIYEEAKGQLVVKCLNKKAITFH